MWSRRVLAAVLFAVLVAGAAPDALAGTTYDTSFNHSGGTGKLDNPAGGICLLLFLIFFILVLLNSIFTYSKKWTFILGGPRSSEPLYYIYSPADIAAKVQKTARLLDFVSRTDPVFAPDALRRLASESYVAFQQHWQARDYAPLESWMMPDLYSEHCDQINAMIRLHEINVIDQLTIERVDLVHVRYTQNHDHREFTALITTRSANYYIDDRGRFWLRGQRSVRPYQELWTFQLHDGKFLLREVEQTAESCILKEDDFFEPFTDTTAEQIVGTDETGPAGPAIPQPVLSKSERIDRLLNFLGQTDKLWDRQLMLKRARLAFLEVHLAQEAGHSAAVPTDLLFPEIAEWLTRQIEARREEGTAIEFRSLCVRKADLVLIKNALGHDNDEFVVYFTAHALRILRRGDQVLQRDSVVAKFDAYWTFGRHEGQWKLKEILPPARGAAALEQENVDLEASPEQLQWFYRQKRAV